MGIGVTPEQRQRMFQPFVQGDGSITRRFGGTGLGLTISQRLVEMMGGSINVESVPDRGSTFWFFVPLERRSVDPHMTVKEKLVGSRALVVDDEVGAREILAQYLTSWGMRNQCVCSAEAALETLRQAHKEGDPFDLVVVDMVLPDKDGLALSREITADRDICATKLVLLTAFDAPGLGKQAIDLGYKGFLTKPVRQSQLLECLLGVICGREPLNDRAAVDARKGHIMFRGAMVLIVEDHAISQQIAQLYLEDMGCICHIVNNGSEAVEAVATTNYDLILMDCQMPIQDGFAATAAIRKAEIETGNHVPIIAMTARALEGDRQMCISVGMDDYITKPVDPRQLRVVMANWLTVQVESAEAHAAVSVCQTDLPIDVLALEDKYGEVHESLLRLFLKNSPAEFEKLKAALVGRDREMVNEIAHGLGGDCASICALRMARLCVGVEVAAASQDWQTIERLIVELADEAELVNGVLRRLL